MRYRVVTLDGQILGHRASKKEAIALALQQARRLAESIEVKRRNRDGEYEYLTMAMNPYKFETQDEDDITRQRK